MTENTKKTETLKAIFNARKLAVVGVSSNPLKDGYTTLETIVNGGFDGRLYPVNPRGGEICGVKVYTDLDEIQDTLDAVVIIVRADIVPKIMAQAAKKGAKGAIILSGGFRESGREDLEDEILAVAEKFNIKIMGPNIQGINYLANKMCAMMFPVIKMQGPLCIISQSGTVTAGLCEWAEADQFGISAAINLGNKTELCESDYIDYFCEDENTGTIAVYIENIKDGQKFLKSIEGAVPKKPVAVLRSGRSKAGIRAAVSHTGALAGDYAVFESACRQYGAFPTDNLTQLYDAAMGMGSLKPPKGRRVFIISSSGGVCTLSTDEAESNGLTVPLLPEKLTTELKNLDLFSPLANLSNPMDLVETIGEHFLAAARLVDQHNAADIILLAFGDPVPESINLIKTLNKELTASLAVSYIGGGTQEQETRLTLQREGIPVFASPERALSGIAASVYRAEYLRSRGLDQGENVK